jgi:CRP-like cAMP-binding protein
LSSIRSALELALGLLPEDELSALMHVVVSRTYPADSIICREGQLEHLFYIIQEGQVAFTKQMAEGQQFLGIAPHAQRQCWL